MRGSEAGQGRVLGRRVGGIPAAGLTEGRSGRVEAGSARAHRPFSRTAQQKVPAGLESRMANPDCVYLIILRFGQGVSFIVLRFGHVYL